MIYATSTPGPRHTAWHVGLYHVDGRCSLYGISCVVLAEIEVAHGDALELNVKWDSIIRLEGNGTTNPARLLTAAELRAELVNDGYPEPARPRKVAATDLTTSVSTASDAELRMRARSLEINGYAEMSTLVLREHVARRIAEDSYVTKSVNFDETDQTTWGEVPAGYEWRLVSDDEEHLFAPDGRDLSAPISAAYTNGCAIESGSYWQPAGWSGVSVRVSVVLHGVVTYRTNAGCGAAHKMPVAEFLKKAQPIPRKTR